MKKYLSIWLLLTTAALAQEAADPCLGVKFNIPRHRVPLRDQGSTTHCASCVTASLLDNINRDSGVISHIDVASKNPLRPADEIGKTVDTSCSGAVEWIAAGLQKNHCVVGMRKPSDQEFIDMANLVNKYFDANTPLGVLNGLNPQECGAELYKKSGGRIKNLPPIFVANAPVPAPPNLFEYQDRVLKQGGYTKIDYSKDSKAIPFSFRVSEVPVSASDSVGLGLLLDELREVGMKDRPLAVNLCAKKLPRNASVNDGDDCGSHVMLITGVESVNGVCMIELQDSNGDRWPSPNGGGRDKFMIHELWNARPPVTSNVPMKLVSLAPYDPKTPPQNQMIRYVPSENGGFTPFVLQGEFSYGNKDALLTHGLYLKNGSVMIGGEKVAEGEFDAEGKLVTGHAVAPMTNPSRPEEILDHIDFKDGAIINANFFRSSAVPAVIGAQGEQTRLVTNYAGKIENGRYGAAKKTMAREKLDPGTGQWNLIGLETFDLKLSPDGKQEIP